MHDNPQAPPGQAAALPGHRLIELSGRDAAAFAQAQFMNDVAALAPGHWQWNGWLTPKGRVIALMALLRLADERIWLLLPDADAEAFAAALRRFLFRSKTTIAVRDDLRAIGRYGAPQAARGAALAGDEAAGVELDYSAEGAARSLRIVAAHAAGPEDADVARRWALDDLRHGLPCLGADQTEQWTPQQLSLERLQAFSVKKGCYPGQEIVARTHFLGKAKRGLMRLRGPGIEQRDEVSAIVSSGLVDTLEVLGYTICTAGDEGLIVLPLDMPQRPLMSGGYPCELLPLLGGLAR